MGRESQSPSEFNDQHLLSRRHRVRSSLRNKTYLHNRHVFLQSVSHSLDGTDHFLSTLYSRHNHAGPQDLCCSSCSTMFWGYQWSNVRIIVVERNGVGWNPRRGSTNGGHECHLHKPATTTRSRPAAHKRNWWHIVRKPGCWFPQCGGSSCAETCYSR
jgi:hypothetical protein